ncbi:hypothetical protein PAXRUDRAFT_22087 [Paxillus rubicundulus Ve08.2h10]|uniref:Uncharacterized protein n=1 Tax=Paxillus rubicundulus Ve08.2h10 TaxID=930991 RepID=A0A0D0BL15_9AGAM|nr:hypothetical protein PAXRUDRAFT_22087 [Paxillus rubicundulus Ve08.2h10]
MIYLALPGSMVFAAFEQVQSKLYAISLVASLNARKATLAEARTAIPTTDDVSHPSFAKHVGMSKADDQNSLQGTLILSTIVSANNIHIHDDDDDSPQRLSEP